MHKTCGHDSQQRPHVPMIQNYVRDSTHTPRLRTPTNTDMKTCWNAPNVASLTKQQSTEKIMAAKQSVIFKQPTYSWIP